MTSRPVLETVASPVAGTYRIDPARSRIGVSTRHLFGLGAVRGSFALLDGEICVPDGPGEPSARATVDAGSFASGNLSRDAAVRSPRLLDVAAHPAITFVSDRLTTAAGRPELAGWLTVRDTTQEVVLAVDDLDCTRSELRLRAVTRIDRYAFGVTGYRGLAARRLDVRLDVVAVPTAVRQGRSGVLSS